MEPDVSDGVKDDFLGNIPHGVFAPSPNLIAAKQGLDKSASQIEGRSEEIGSSIGSGQVIHNIFFAKFL